MEAGMAPPKPPRLTTEEESALMSQVLEIIGGITREALQSYDQPEEREVWSMEEGDDSVFYSDEDQAQKDVKSLDDGERVVKGEGEKTELVQQTGDEPEIQKEEVLPGEREEESIEVQIQRTEPTQELHSSDPEMEREVTPEEILMDTSEESVQPDCTDTDMQTQTAQSASPQTENLVQEAELSNLKAAHAAEEKGKEEEEEAEILIDTSLKTSEVKPQVQTPHVPAGFHKGASSQGYSTLPTMSQHESFDHLSTSKYSTVSYRKIRRGNTRRKIEEFEYMIMNL